MCAHILIACRVVVRRAAYGLVKTVLQRLPELATQELSRLAPLIFAATAEKVIWLFAYSSVLSTQYY